MEGIAGSKVGGRASRAKPPKLWLTHESERQEDEAERALVLDVTGHSRGMTEADAPDVGSHLLSTCSVLLHHSCEP